VDRIYSVTTFRIASTMSWHQRFDELARQTRSSPILRAARPHPRDQVAVTVESVRHRA
jgi:hypothetical protein